ncbi:MAG TPA: glycosyl transferase, partial [Planctomycetia bacterium]|nr:glycosyl transferase [Planctomycetia bacterium]
LGHRFAARTFGLRLVELADWARARFQGISYGDQAQFFRPAALRAAGGFPAQPLMEDLELSLRLRKLGKPAYLGVLATVSGRRFLRDGWWRTLGLNRRLRAAYRRGGPALAADLYRRYYPKRQELADKGQA